MVNFDFYMERDLRVMDGKKTIYFDSERFI